MQFKQIFLIFVLSLSLTGCGLPTAPRGPQNYGETVYSNNPIALNQQKESCLSSFSLDEYIFITIERFIGGFLVAENLNFTNQIQNTSLRSPKKGPIKNSIINHESSEFYIAKYNKQSDNYTYFLTKKTQSSSIDYLQICPEVTRYDRDTFEAAGLIVSKSITKTYNKVIEHISKEKLSPITLYVAPLNQRIIKVKGGSYNKDQFIKYETDNAYYHPKHKSISFLPQSEEQREVNKSPLWEIPTVGSHEYGHHIFNSLISGQRLTQEIMSSKASHSCFGDTVQRKRKMQGDSVRDNGYQFALRSINEGFADLIAFYTLDSNERSLKGVNCFEGVREVDKSNFNMTQAKEITVEGKRLMDSSLSVESDKNCLTPNYQEVHDVGAIFAYHANRLLDLTTQSIDSKLKILLKLASSMDKVTLTSSNLASKYLFSSLELLYKLALESNDTTIDPQKHCQDVNQLFIDSTYQCNFLK